MGDQDKFSIHYLADQVDLVPTLAEWFYQQWSYLNPGDSIPKRVERLQKRCRRGEIPTTFVGLVRGRLVGSASLIASDMDSHPELTPWLASVFVASEYRKRGFGSSLVRRVMDEARSLGIPTLYLFTPDQEALYFRLGWRLRARETYRVERVALMETHLC